MALQLNKRAAIAAFTLMLGSAGCKSVSMSCKSSATISERLPAVFSPAEPGREIVRSLGAGVEPGAYLKCSYND